jgi:hypothetical protein
MSEINRSYITTLAFFALLMLGPIQPYGLAIRFAYLLALPTAVWFGLKWFGERWHVDAEFDERINRALTASLSGVFFVIAYHEFTLTHHMECSQWVPTRDGQECVGDDVVVKGGDIVGGAISLLVCSLAFWHAISKRGED